MCGVVWCVYVRGEKEGREGEKSKRETNHQPEGRGAQGMRGRGGVNEDKRLIEKNTRIRFFWGIMIYILNRERKNEEEGDMMTTIAISGL